MRRTGNLWAAWRSLAKRCPACSNWSRAPGSCRIIQVKQLVLLIGPKLCSVKLHERSRALGNVFFSVLCLLCPLSLTFQTFVPLSTCKSPWACHVWENRLPDQDSQLQTQDSTGVPSITQGFSRKILLRSQALNRQETVLIKSLFLESAQKKTNKAEPSS